MKIWNEWASVYYILLILLAVIIAAVVFFSNVLILTIYLRYSGHVLSYVFDVYAANLVFCFFFFIYFCIMTILCVFLLNLTEKSFSVFANGRLFQK